MFVSTLLQSIALSATTLSTPLPPQHEMQAFALSWNNTLRSAEAKARLLFFTESSTLLLEGFFLGYETGLHNGF